MLNIHDSRFTIHTECELTLVPKCSIVVIFGLTFKKISHGHGRRESITIVNARDS